MIFLKSILLFSGWDYEVPGKDFNSIGSSRVYLKYNHYWIVLLLVQSTLGFETLDKAAALGLATAIPLTDLRQYINSDLGYSNLEIWLLYSK